MAESITRRKFVSHLINYAEKYEVDGIDIDWEYWSYQSEQGKGGNDPIESQYLVKLLQDLREQLPPSMLLTVDIAPGNWLGAQYNVEIQDYVDYVDYANLMAFGFTGRWDE